MSKLKNLYLDGLKIGLSTLRYFTGEIDQVQINGVIPWEELNKLYKLGEKKTVCKEELMQLIDYVYR